eukprot:TRINITY_DN66470_c0_g1_i1.p1 TRINITY_DN66470_c0_g1~~TRINITY_DN66470_c0_g1_i1.p1  ORF type:complete len:145 (+),score=16.50 TRINITY_DN66470_c0_g1_i1:71-505(+)
MTQAGLHACAHTVVADGSGRDCNVFQDKGWQLGTYGARGMEPKYHPLFNRLEKPKLYTIEPPPMALTALEKSQSQSSLRSGQTRAYKMQAGGRILYLAKDEIGTGTLPKPRHTEDETFVKRTQSTPKFRTRQTVTSFDMWANKR